tara:strand:+ start:132 stop:671 length:540 start_codon:yes stop_codon:yes gene_type:complete
MSKDIDIDKEIERINKEIRLVRLQKQLRIANKKSYSKPVDHSGKSCYLYIYRSREHELVEDIIFDGVIKENDGYVKEICFIGKGSEYNIHDLVNNKKYSKIVGNLGFNMPAPLPFPFPIPVGAETLYEKNYEKNYLQNASGTTNCDIVILEIGGHKNRSKVSGMIEFLVLEEGYDNKFN